MSVVNAVRNGPVPMTGDALGVSMSAGMSAEVRLIYPNEAKDLLKHGGENVRKPKKNWARQLAEAFRRGEGQLTWDAIAIGPGGELLNGQHRMEAVILSGVPLPCLVLRGFPDVEVCAGDRASARTIGEIFAARGEKNAKGLAALMNRLANFERSGMLCEAGGKYALTPALAIEMLEDNPDTRQAVEHRRVLPGVWPGTASLAWLLFNRVDAMDAAGFFTGVSTGAGLDEGDVRLLLRNRLLANESDSVKALPEKVITAFIVQAWNAYRRGEERLIFRFRPGGSRPERFPLIDGLEYRPEALARLEKHS